MSQLQSVLAAKDKQIADLQSKFLAQFKLTNQKASQIKTLEEDRDNLKQQLESAMNVHGKFEVDLQTLQSELRAKIEADKGIKP